VIAMSPKPWSQNGHIGYDRNEKGFTRRDANPYAARTEAGRNGISRQFWQKVLNLARLPIPPLRRRNPVSARNRVTFGSSYAPAGNSVKRRVRLAAMRYGALAAQTRSAGASPLNDNAAASAPWPEARPAFPAGTADSRARIVEFPAGPPPYLQTTSPRIAEPPRAFSGRKLV